MFFIVLLFSSHLEKLTNLFVLFCNRKIFRQLNRPSQSLTAMLLAAPEIILSLCPIWLCPRKYSFLFFSKELLFKNIQRYFSVRSLDVFAKKLNEVSFWLRPSKHIPPSFPFLAFECCLISHKH